MIFVAIDAEPLPLPQRLGLSAGPGALIACSNCWDHVLEIASTVQASSFIQTSTLGLLADDVRHNSIGCPPELTGEPVGCATGNCNPQSQASKCRKLKCGNSNAGSCRQCRRKTVLTLTSGK